MSVEIKGFEKLLDDLEKQYGEKAMTKLSDQSLKAGAQAFVDELKRQFESFKDKGYSIEEIKVSRPKYVNGIRTVTVHWKGEHERYRIIHLNEWGTVKNPNPKGKGKIAIAERNAKAAFERAVKETFRRGI